MKNIFQFHTFKPFAFNLFLLTSNIFANLSVLLCYQWWLCFCLKAMCQSWKRVITTKSGPLLQVGLMVE